MTEYENCYEKNCTRRAIYFVAYQQHGSGPYKDAKLLCGFHARRLTKNNSEDYLIILINF